MRSTTIRNIGIVLILFTLSCSSSRKRSDEPDSDTNDAANGGRATAGFDSDSGESSGAGGLGRTDGESGTFGSVNGGGIDGSGGTDQQDAVIKDGQAPEGGGAGGMIIDGSGGVPADSGRDGMATDGEVDDSCCLEDDCLCHGPAPAGLTSENGPYSTDHYDLENIKVYYPTDAEPPFAAIAINDDSNSTGTSRMGAWASFFASWGIVCASVYNSLTILPDLDATDLLTAIEQLKEENTNSDSPLFGTMSGRYGISAFAMSASGCWIAAARDPSLKTSMTMAGMQVLEGGPLAESGNTRVPTLMLCGSADTIGTVGQSQQVYDVIPETTLKLLFEIEGASHAWFDPTQAGAGAPGEYALAFQKAFLEGDHRWRPLLLEQPDYASYWLTNIR